MTSTTTTRRLGLAAWLLAFAASVSAASTADDDGSAAKLRALPWQRGPATAQIGDKSSVALPKDVAFLDEQQGSRFLELTGNLPDPGTSVIATDGWWATFNFSPVGYVKDDDKIDADELLKSIKESDGPANEERRRRGMAELHTEGWYLPPHYDSQTKNLEWALRFSTPGEPRPIVNYTVRLLGRTGIESVVLVSSPETMDADVRSLKAVLKGFDFKQGEKYSEFRPGDHVAEFGLAALVAGGAAAVAVKTGFWKVIVAFLAASWKLILGAGVALFAAIGKLFGKKPAK